MKSDELFGLKALGRDKPEDYIKWAEEQLLSGSDSYNLAILASLDFEKFINTHELLSYFSKSLQDLNIMQPNKGTALKKYSALISKKIIREEIKPRDGLSALSHLYPASDYSERLYSLWYELEDDILSLETNYDPIYNSGLSLTNIDNHIQNVAKQYLSLINMTLPENFFKLVYCFNCYEILEPAMKRIEIPWLSNSVFRFIFRRSPAHQLVCVNCGSKKLAPMSNYEGREKYLFLFAKS